MRRLLLVGLLVLAVPAAEAKPVAIRASRFTPRTAAVARRRRKRRLRIRRCGATR